MMDIDHVNILDGLVFEIVFDKMEKSGVEKSSFRGGNIIISVRVSSEIFIVSHRSWHVNIPKSATLL